MERNNTNSSELQFPILSAEEIRESRVIPHIIP